MVVTFLIGFSLHAINFIVAGFVEPSLRAVWFKGGREEGLTAETRSLTYKIEIIETTFRLIFIGYSLYQISALGTPAITYCTDEKNVLSMEVEWMTMLALSQLAFVPFFYIWRFLVQSADSSAAEAASKIKIPEKFSDYSYNPWSVK